MQLEAVAATRRPGRPPKDAAAKLSEVLRVRVTPDDADSLYKLAIRHGEPLNAVLRMVLRRLIERSQP